MAGSFNRNSSKNVSISKRRGCESHRQSYADIVAERTFICRGDAVLSADFFVPSIPMRVFGGYALQKIKLDLTDLKSISIKSYIERSTSTGSFQPVEVLQTGSVKSRICELEDYKAGIGNLTQRPKPDRRYRYPISTDLATFDQIDCQVFGEQNHLRTESLRTISSQHFKLSHYSDKASAISTLWPNEVKIMSI